MTHVGIWDDEIIRRCTKVPLGTHFGGKGQRGLTLRAKEACISCGVRVTCLDGALARNEPAGVWGGMTHKERHAERKARGMAGRSPFLSASA